MERSGPVFCSLASELSQNTAIAAGISFIDAGYSERYNINRGNKMESKVDGDNSSGSCITYENLNSLLALTSTPKHSAVIHNSVHSLVKLTKRYQIGSFHLTSSPPCWCTGQQKKKKKSLLGI